MGGRQGVRALGPLFGNRPGGAHWASPAGAIRLEVNGELRQSGDLAQMIWDVPSQIAVLSTYFELAAGDLVMTGTPAGVGPVAVGDQLHAEIEGVGSLTVIVI